MKNIQRKGLVLSILLSVSVFANPVIVAAPAWISNSWNTTKSGLNNFSNKTTDLAKASYSSTVSGAKNSFGYVKNACNNGASYVNNNRKKTFLGVAGATALAAFTYFIWNNIKKTGWFGVA